MNLLYGQIVEIASEDGMRVGKIQVARAFKKISLVLIGEAQIGDRVLVCDGIAISKEEPIEPLSEQLLSATQGQHANTAVLQPSNTPLAELESANEALNEPVQGSFEDKIMCLAIPGKLIEISQDAQGVRMGRCKLWRYRQTGLFGIHAGSEHG